MAEHSGNGILEEFRIEFLDCWRRLPNKAFFFALLVAWLAMFQFLGNSTLGYARTSSLFLWTFKSLTAGTGNLVESEEGFGVLVPFIVLALFWVKRSELMAVEAKEWWPGLMLILLGIAFHTLGYLVQQPKVSLVGLFTGIYGLMGLAWGLAWLRASFFPFFLFVFCIPLGSQLVGITFRLRLLVCQLVEMISHFLLAIDVVREGTILKDPTNKYQYEVAAACSGIRSLIATVGFALILGFLAFGSWWKRGVMLAAALPLAVLGNLIRMLSIIIAAELGGQEWGNRVHDGGPGGIFALLLYIPAFAGLLGLEYLLRGRTPRPAPALEATTS
jgi:exosortase